MLAPIVLFVYNRPEHTRQTLNALSNNSLASQSTLYIFSDGEPDHCSDETVEKIKQVRLIIREKQWCKEIIIKEAKQNQGLAKSVINGVTEVITKHGKIIVLEDDLIPSHYFLDFMNQSLDRYEEHQEIFQISGFSFPSKKIKSENSSYFLPLTSTWGWATWKRVWDLIDFECNDYSVLKQDRKLAYRFNFNGSYNYKKMFIQQMESQKISSWGIRFYWNAFKNDALILFPDKSLVLNNGWDNSGRHNDNYNVFPINNWDLNYRIKNFPESIMSHKKNINVISKYIKKRTSIFTKILFNIHTIIKQSFTK